MPRVGKIQKNEIGGKGMRRKSFMKNDTISVFFEVTGAKIRETIIQFKRKRTPQRVEVFTNNGRFPSVEIRKSSISIKAGKASFWGRPWIGTRSFSDTHFFYSGSTCPLASCGTYRIEKIRWRPPDSQR